MDARAASDPAEAGSSGQLRLSDLSLWVLAAGVAAYLLRGSQIRLNGRGNEIEPNRLAGILLAALAIGLTLPLVVWLARWLRGSLTSTEASRWSQAWAVCWRIMAAAALLSGVSAERQALGEVDSAHLESSLGFYYQKFIQPTRLDLFPIGLALLLIGVTLGLAPATRDPTPRRRGRAAFVVLAALAGVLLATNPEVALFPYLVLVALEGVSNALVNPAHVGPLRPRLFVRLEHAGLAAAIGGVILLGMALWVARDFRRGAIEAKITPGWLLARLLAVTATAAVGLELAFVEFPRLDPSITEGFALVLGPIEIAAIASGFLAFSAGLASRSLANPTAEARESRGWPLRLAKVAGWGVVFGLFGLVAIHAAASLIDTPVGDMPDDVRTRLAWAFSRVAAADSWLFVDGPAADLLRATIAPDRVIWTLVLLWLFSRLVSLAMLGRDRRPAPLDAVADSPRAFARFLWLSLGLTSVCLASMPAFLLAGVSLFHLRLHAGDIFGWGN